MDFQKLKNLQGKVHFIGLGGIGMSALALILREFNIAVQGSDLSENYLTEKLRKKNIQYFVGHDAKNVSSDVALIVQTSIIKTSNPEIIEAEKRNIPIITRAQLLAIVMSQYKGITIAGTHGKTSTTGMVSLMLEIAGFDPTIINGGVINYFSSNAKIGKGEYLIAESDESDGSFVALPSFIGAVTNIQPEHLEFQAYGGDFEIQKSYFEKYIAQIPADGLCVLCLDSPEVNKIYQKIKNDKKNLLTYSLGTCLDLIPTQEADLTAKNIVLSSVGIAFDVEFRGGRKILGIKMPIYGKHNVSNALVAIAIADFLGISDEKIIKALASFNGVKRRFTKVGEYQGVSIIDDYGHHPTEIQATLAAARSVVGDKKIISVFEPHKYSRLHDLFDEFSRCFFDADMVIVCEIYAASQSPIEGITQDAIAEAIKKSGHKNVIKLTQKSDLAKIIKANAQSGDMVLCTGAGSITYLAASLENDLKNLA